LKVSANVKIAMQCFEIFGGGKMPQTPHPWLRLLVNERLAVAKGKAYAVLS